jgi:hypothetical protein
LNAGQTIFIHAGRHGRLLLVVLISPQPTAAVIVKSPARIERASRLSRRRGRSDRRAAKYLGKFFVDRDKIAQLVIEIGARLVFRNTSQLPHFLIDL